MFHIIESSAYIYYVFGLRYILVSGVITNGIYMDPREITLCVWDCYVIVLRRIWDQIFMLCCVMIFLFIISKINTLMQILHVGCIHPLLQRKDLYLMFLCLHWTIYHHTDRLLWRKVYFYIIDCICSLLLWVCGYVDLYIFVMQCLLWLFFALVQKNLSVLVPGIAYMCKKFLGVSYFMMTGYNREVLVMVYKDAVFSYL